MHLIRARGQAWRRWVFLVACAVMAAASFSPAEASEPAKSRSWYTGWGFGPIDLTLAFIGRPVPGPPPLLPRPQPRVPAMSETAGAPDMS